MFNPEFLLTALIVVLLPGTGVIYTVSMGLIYGRRASTFAAIGCTLGIVPHLLASVSGLAALLHTSALAFQFIKYLGVIYLAYLAWSMWKNAGSLQLESSDDHKKQQLLNIAQRAFLTNILNPKLSIFFLAFLPQFVPADSSSATLTMLGLSSIFMLLTLIVFTLYGLFAHQVRQYINHSPQWLTWLQRTFAGIFIALGAKLAMAER